MRQLYYSDNLPVLRTMQDGFVDLIYLDPPFNSNRAYNIIYPNDLGQVTAFEDTWAWTPECDVFLGNLQTANPKAAGLVAALVEDEGERKTQLSAYLVNMAVRLVEMHRVLKPTGSLYLHCDPTASHYLKIVLDSIFGQDNFRNEIVWSYQTGGVSHRWFGRKHDIIFLYSRSDRYFIDLDRVKDQRTPEVLRRLATGNESATRARDETRLPFDVWTNIQALNAMANERLGYPTQKPLALLDRILQASSNPGDIVLDPFCGCGTSIEAAENRNRQWIGIDITYAAIAAIQERFRRNRIDVWDKIEISGQPKTIADVDSSLLDENSPLYARKEFEKFCVAVIGGVPNNKMGADGGIDGRIALVENKQAIVSVKSGAVDVRQVRELKGLLTDKQVAGVFITRQPPTRPMVEFANQAGLVQGVTTGFFQGKSFPAMQLFTLEDILSGKRPRLPYANPN